MDKLLVIKSLLEFDPEFSVRCMMMLYDRQTLEEQLSKDSVQVNGIGFNKADAPVLCPIAETFRNTGMPVPEKDIGEVLHRMPKYAEQLLTSIKDEEL